MSRVYGFRRKFGGANRSNDEEAVYVLRACMHNKGGGRLFTSVDCFDNVRMCVGLTETEFITRPLSGSVYEVIRPISKFFLDSSFMRHFVFSIECH